jgi:hypothetical protein
LMVKLEMCPLSVRPNANSVCGTCLTVLVRSMLKKSHSAGALGGGVSALQGSDWR